MALAAAVVPSAAMADRGEGAAGRPAHTLVQLRASAGCDGAADLLSAGATVVSGELRLYRLPAAVAREVVPALRTRGAVARVQPDRLVGTVARIDFDDPLVGTEWWRAAIGVDGLTPPGPGKPVTIVDSGVNVTHPEFLGRPNLETLNPQEPAPLGGEHGTGVASVVGAPVNGLGLVGVYPEAVLRSWDAAIGEGTRLESSEIVQGIIAAANSGPGVINLSLGGPQRDLFIEQAVYTAVRKGSLVVAASGNDGDRGNQLGYPAGVPHVLTVGATNRDNAVAFFSSRSNFVDVAAPGEGIPIATAIEQGYREADGTSFASPIVAGAAAWLWTVRPKLQASQVAEIIRRSATDIGVPGRDPGSGFGLLNVPAALAFPAPPLDPLEPNDNIDFLSPDGEFATGISSLTLKSRVSTRVRALVDRYEDPADVYRVWLPPNRTLRVTATATADVDLSLWRLGSNSIKTRFPGNDRLARATAKGTTETLEYRNAGPGRMAYLAVVPAPGVTVSEYTMRIAVRR